MDMSNMEGYFLSLEYWFVAAGLPATQDLRRFHFVMAKVPPHVLQEFKIKWEQAPTSSKYEYARKVHTEHNSEYQQRHLQRVLSEMTLGNQKPSQLCNEMLRVAKDAISEELLMNL
ncbi:uncharacterized protein LOC128273970 [Anopheles cruzii]|uniref:uncharacterized protein LOC128273970 n=1 Tax=Anopheles cruzii TaxID=68878 RepID=UPI0022EC1CF4|nr:uncharacterized protein LOC128273970 [Anopheles cruzii]